jgi:hypothetical protein
MKPFKYIKVKRFILSVGWFQGEPFKLLNLTILEVWDHRDGITLIDFQLAKFCFSLAWQYD